MAVLIVPGKPVQGIPTRLSSVNQEACARKLRRLALIAEGLRSAAALSPNDPDLQSRMSAAGTACQQLVSYLRRQEPVADQLARLTAERTAALDAMRTAGRDMDAFRAASKREAELAARIRQLRAEVPHGR